MRKIDASSPSQGACSAIQAFRLRGAPRGALRFAGLLVGVSMLRFGHLGQYDYDSADDHDDSWPMKRVVAAFSTLRDALRSIGIATDPDATV